MPHNVSIDTGRTRRQDLATRWVAFRIFDTEERSRCVSTAVEDFVDSLQKTVSRAGSLSQTEHTQLRLRRWERQSRYCGA
jgi:hypothetical protein